MKKVHLTIAICALGALVGCAEEPPPPTVNEFLADSVLLEATMVRCSANRSSTKYEPECVNAREASNRIGRAEEQERRARLEEQSERKRRALRRTQEAAAEARRLAAEARRRREEAAYLSQFEGPVEGSESNLQPGGTGVIDDPGAAVPRQDLAPETGTPQGQPTPDPQQPPMPAEDPVSTPASGDLDAIREELRRRQDGTQ